MEMNEDKARQIVQKHKKRFSWKLSLQVVRVLLGIFLVYAVYMIAISIIYHETKIKDQTEHYLQLAIDWTMPGVTTDISSMAVNNISPLLTQKIDMPLLKRIGKEEQHVSTMHVRKPLLSSLTSMEEDSSVTEDQLSFYLPYNPETGVKSDVISREQVWERLEMIHEGNVAQLAFSLTDYYTPEEVVTLLEPYDLDILWMPLYMGELQSFSEGSWGTSGNNISLGKPWGLAGSRITDDQFQSGSMAPWLSKETIKESEQAMVDNMERMLTDRKGLAETFLQTDFLQERYDYLKNEGFQVYGAVVTGPVKELLKLREVEEIHEEQLGDMDYWNWVE